MFLDRDQGLKYTFFNKSIAKSKPLNDSLSGNIRIKIEANKWSAERKQNAHKTLCTMHATEYDASKQKYIVLRKTFSASDSSLLSSFYVRNQITHAHSHMNCASHRKKKRKKTIK